MDEPVRTTRVTYDRIAREYAARSQLGYPGLADDIAWFAGRLPVDGWVADVGCGPGRDTRLLRRAGLRVVGLDISAGQLTAGGLPRVAQADMRFLPLRTACLDGVWCMAALLHLPRAFVPGVLAGFARVVRAGGTLCLTVAEGDGAGFEPTTAYDAALPRWFTYHREAPLRELLSGAGFDVEDVYRDRSHRDWLQLRALRR